tara:strand:+ start:8 stop:394 length:387 start_codon:yes stop_codon:yes gene_type:complete
MSDSLTDKLSFNNIKLYSYVDNQLLSAIGTVDTNIKKIKNIRTSLNDETAKEQLKLDIKDLFINITYEDLCKKIDAAQKLIKVYNLLSSEEQDKFIGYTTEVENMVNISALIKEIKVDKGIDFEKYFT